MVMLKQKLWRAGGRVARRVGVLGPARRLVRGGAVVVAGGAKKHAIKERVRLVDRAAIGFATQKAVAVLVEQGVEVDTYLEFGVFNGSTMIAMTRALEEAGVTGVRSFGFDTFEGLPDFATSDCGGHWQPGQFKSSIEFTRSVLEYEGVDLTRVELVKGLFSETCTPQFRAARGIEKAPLVMIDCDLYQSTVDALAFCGPILADTSVVLFDDWFPLAEKNEGEKAAWDEFLAANPQWRAEEVFTYDPYGIAFKVTRVS